MSFVERFVILCPYLVESTIGGSLCRDGMHGREVDCRNITDPDSISTLTPHNCTVNILYDMLLQQYKQAQYCMYTNYFSKVILKTLKSHFLTLLCAWLVYLQPLRGMSGGVQLLLLTEQ